MSKKCFKKILLVFFTIFIILSVIFYKPIEYYFIEQCHNPTGLVGSIMIKIWNRTFEDMSNWAIEKVDIAESDYILDVGCGGGQTVYNLAKKAKKGQVSGIDISSEAVKSSIEKNKREIENGKVKIYEADVANLPFTSEYFDEITAIQTHIYWDDLKKGLSEIYRVLKIHGQLLIVCEKDKINYHMKSYKENDEMKQLLFEIGFKKITINESGNWIVFICDKD